MRLTGAVALVTGASSGIGRATARRLAVAGATVLLAGRDEDALAAVAAEMGGHPVPGDLAVLGGPELVAAAALGVAGRIDLLVNNAGVGWAGPVAAMVAADIDRLVAVNLTAPMALTRALLPGMVQRGCGHLVMVTSVAGATGVPGESVYAATKAGLATFADSLRLEVASSGVGVTTVAPGVVATAFFDRRNRPYERRWPQPIPADRVAAAIVEAVRRDRPEVWVPGWLRLPARLRGAAPALYRALAGRLG
ncbi:MAG: SDR family NAD(P)-dependent oxidoreductase [Frankiaceae bacterium]